MSTRRLILLALACGLAILVAGSVQLLRIRGNDGSTLQVGDSAELATVVATVTSASVVGNGVQVEVQLRQAPSASTPIDDGLGGWSLLTGGLKEPVAAVPAAGGSLPPCGSVTLSPGSTADCVLAFPVTPSEDGTTYVSFAFAGSSATWRLGV